MKRREYLIKVFRDTKIYYKAEWVFSLFTVVRDSDITLIEEPYDYQIATNDGKYHYYLNSQWNPFEDSPSIDRPLCLVEEGIIVNEQKELTQSYHEFPLKTRLGTFFINHYCLVSALGNKIPYQNGQLSISGLEDIVAKKLKDRVANEPDDPNAIYPDEAIKFSSACSSVSGFSTIANPSATKYTMVPAPGIQEYRKQLLEQYKDKLDDPAIVALIDKRLVEYDKNYQSQDPEGGFYINNKAFDVSRKKLFVMHGLEQPEVSGGKVTLIENSLSEGWDINKLPAMIDSMRDGSYNRGAMTALGGEAVKFIFRIFATTRITEEDCGAKIGLPVTLTDNNIKKYEGNTIILSGKQIKLDSTNMKQYVGQSVMVRSPGMCRTSHSNFCMTCLGEKLRGSENSLAALASEVGSKMLSIFMAKMHGTALTTTQWRWQETIH